MRSFIQKSALLVFSVLLLSCSRYTPAPVTTTSGPASAPSSTVSSNSAMENSILANVNAHRRAMGLQSLQMIAAASQQAYNHSKNMATGITAFGHDGFNQRVANIEQTLGRSSGYAENVAYGSLSSKEVVDVWLNSPPHRKNLDGNYNLTGIGIYKDREGTIYFTQIFLRK